MDKPRPVFECPGNTIANKRGRRKSWSNEALTMVKTPLNLALTSTLTLFLISQKRYHSAITCVVKKHFCCNVFSCMLSYLNNYAQDSCPHTICSSNKKMQFVYNSLITGLHLRFFIFIFIHRYRVIYSLIADF